MEVIKETTIKLNNNLECQPTEEGFYIALLYTPFLDSIEMLEIRFSAEEGGWQYDSLHSHAKTPEEKEREWSVLYWFDPNEVPAIKYLTSLLDFEDVCEVFKLHKQIKKQEGIIIPERNDENESTEA